MRTLVCAVVLAALPSVVSFGGVALTRRAVAARPLATPAFALATPAVPSSTRRRATSPVASLVVPEDYKLSVGFVAVGLLLLVAPWIPGGFSLILGTFLLFQTLRIRFVFDDDAFEVKSKPLDDLFSPDLTDTGENFAVGGENRWSYSSFVNYDFFPSESLPILVYFKETQTPEDKWDVGPGKWANGEEALAKGAVKGQVHFFPCIAKADVLKENFVAKGCKKL